VGEEDDESIILPAALLLAGLNCPRKEGRPEGEEEDEL
jgi:hypothetical protein